MRVVYHRIGDELERFLGAGGGPYHLVSPFISVGLLESLIDRHPVRAVYTSWRADHLLSGHSSLDLYPLLRSRGISLVICDRVHAKLVTSGDFSSSLLGSANLTRRGLGLSDTPNLEAAVLFEEDADSIRAIVSSIMVAGRLVDDAVYEVYVHWLEQHEHERTKPAVVAGPVLPASPQGPWMLAQLPASASPRFLWDAVNLDQSSDPITVHDVMLLGGNLVGSRREVLGRMRAALVSNPFFQFLLEQIRGTPQGIHFGGMKLLVQSRCANVPTPHRRDLTELTQNLYRWIVDLYPETFEVVRPKWSEVIRVRP